MERRWLKSTSLDRLDLNAAPPKHWPCWPAPRHKPGLLPGCNWRGRLRGGSKERFPAYAQTTLASVKELHSPDLPGEISALAESLAEAYWLLYGEHDSIEALNLLLAQKTALQRLLNGPAREAESDVGRAVDRLTSDIKRLLDDLGPTRFQDRIYPPDGRLTSQVAEELYLSLFPDEA